MTDLGFLTEFMVPVIVGICLCVGYVVKKWIKDVDNHLCGIRCAFSHLDQRMDNHSIHLIKWLI